MANVVNGVTARTKSKTAYVPQKAETLATAPGLAEAITGGDYGFTQTQANAMLVAIVEMRQILVNAGLAK